MQEIGVIAKGKILRETNGQRWIVGSFIGLSGSAESYEAASFDDKEVTDYPLILRIVPSGDKRLPDGFQFYLNHAKPDDLDNWKRTKHLQHLGIPVLLGAGRLKIDHQNYRFMVIERYGKDLWSLFLERDRKFEAHTAYKISLQIINVLKYTHSKSYYHEDIKASNIFVDIASQNHVYLMNDQLAVHTVSDDQVDPDIICNDVVLSSRDAHMGVSTERGDMEMLFYNLVQWLGIELPWKKNFKDPSLVLKEKKDAFADVDKFLQSLSKQITIPMAVCKYMKLLASMDTKDIPCYAKFKRVLEAGLRKLYHVHYGNLEFSISSVPIIEQTAEDSGQANEPQRRSKKPTSIPNLGASVTRLAFIISENCRHEGEVRLRDIGPGSLIEIIFNLISRKKSGAIQNNIANAWDRDTAGFKTMTKELWKQKGLKAKRRTTNKAIVTEKTVDKPNQNTPTVAAASMEASTSGLNHSNPVMMTPPKEDLASLGLPNIFPPNVRQTLQDAPSASSSRSHVDRSPLFRTSSSGYNSPCSSRVGFHSEDLPLFKSPDPFHEKVPYRSSKNVTSESEKETDSIDDAVSECWRSESVDGDQWSNVYEWLNAWLNMKQLALDAFGPIPSEPTRASNQVQQVRVLLDNFQSQAPRIRQLKNVKLPPDSTDARNLDRIEQRWREQLSWLEERGRKLGETCLGQVEDALQEVSRNLDKLLDEDPEEQQLRKVEILAGQLEAQRALLASAQTVIKQLCQAFSDSTVNADLRNKLRSVDNSYNDLQLRINVKKTEIERSLSDGRQFDESCKEIIVWLAEERDMSEKFIVSADPEKLQQQQKHYQRIMDKEIEVNELLRKSRDFLSRPQNRENVTQHRLHDLMKSQWDSLRNDSLQISKRLQTCTEHLNDYLQARQLLLASLSEIEHKLESIRPASFYDLEEAPTKLSSLRTEIHEKLKEFKQCAKLGDTFVKACDEDKDVVENELTAMEDRWKKLSNNTQERAKFFKVTADNFFACNKCLKDLGQRVDELKSRDTLLEESRDSNLIDSIKELQKEADSLQKPLKDVRQLADELASEVGDQGIDTSCLLKGVDEVAGDIESLSTKLIKSLNTALERKLYSIENDIKPKINIEQEQDVKPSISLPKINWPPGMVIDLTSDNEDEIDCAREGKVKNAEQSSKAAGLERKSQEEKDASIASSSRANEQSENGKKKRKYCRIRSSSDSSDSDYDEKKMKNENSRQGE